MFNKHSYTFLRTAPKLAHNTAGQIEMVVHPDARLAVLCERRSKGVTVEFYSAGGVSVASPQKFMTLRAARDRVAECFPLETCEWRPVPFFEANPVAYAMQALLGTNAEILVRTPDAIEGGSPRA